MPNAHEAPEPQSVPLAPVETKVTAATIAAYFGMTAVLAMLQAFTDTNLISALPPAVTVLVTPLVPALITFVAGWLAQHTPRPPNDPSSA